MFAIHYDESAVLDLVDLRRFEQRRILDEAEAQLGTEPVLPSRRRKLLAGLTPPWDQVRPVWQLRVGDFRVFYDVDEVAHWVIIRAIRRKGTLTTEEIL